VGNFCKTSELSVYTPATNIRAKLQHVVSSHALTEHASRCRRKQGVHQSASPPPPNSRLTARTASQSRDHGGRRHSEILPFVWLKRRRLVELLRHKGTACDAKAPSNQQSPSARTNLTYTASISHSPKPSREQTIRETLNTQNCEADTSGEWDHRA
jgi:hypothetical protein